MTIKLEWMIALRYLRTKKKEGFISVISGFSLIGIALGVATLIIVMSVMNGYEVELIKRIIGINGHLTISKQHEDITNYHEYINDIKKIKGVSYSAALIHGQGMLSSERGSSGVMVRGMESEAIINKPLLRNSLQMGTFYADDVNEIIIGSSLARRLGVSIGDKVKLISASDEVTILGSMPRIKSYEVVGVFDVGMSEYNSGVIFMPLKKAQIYFNHPDSTTDIEVILNNPNMAKVVKNSIASISDNNTTITDWAQSNDQLVAALRVERNVMFLILTLIIVVAAFNIISSLIMLVQDKTKSIAILRTVGMNRVSVLRIFMICGSCIGITGTMLGTIMGVLFSTNVEKIRAWLESLSGVTLFDPVIYYLTKLPSQLDMQNVIIVTSVSILLSFAATIYPAWRAAKLLPAEALRYE